MNSFVRELGKERFVGATKLQRCLVRGDSPVCLTLAPGPTSGSRKGEDVGACPRMRAEDASARVGGREGGLPGP